VSLHVPQAQKPGRAEVSCTVLPACNLEQFLENFTITSYRAGDSLLLYVGLKLLSQIWPPLIKYLPESLFWYRRIEQSIKALEKTLGSRASCLNALKLR
jgi:hypothetical protein